MELERVLAAERMLLDPATRHDRVILESLLAADFAELGQSGRTWTRAEMIEHLVAGGDSEVGDYAISGARLAPAGEGWMLSYALLADGRRSLRESTWIEDAGRLRLVFHRGTSV